MSNEVPPDDPPDDDTPAAPIVEMVPLDRIVVVNPRTRNRAQHREIVDSIRAVGLKRPITVARRTDAEGHSSYDLVCGQGRLEAYQELGETEIPAIVIEGTSDDVLVMSLIENVARRQHRPIDLMIEIGALRNRGYSDAEIAAKVGVTVTWVTQIASLLEQGEQKLVAAVETGLMPLSMAVEIARADDMGVQEALHRAYSEGKLRGRKLGVVRRLLERRQQRDRTIYEGGLGRKNPARSQTPESLVRMLHSEAERQRQMLARAEFAQSRLSFAIEAMRDLHRDPGFGALLAREGLTDMPRQLVERGVGASS